MVSQLVEVGSWLLENPARLLVLISMIVTWCVGVAEYNGRRSGGSGWLTLARLVTGAVFTLFTAIVAGFYGGVGAFFGYLAIQVMVSIVTPIVWLEKM
ncbi:hypothetical protein [Bordetella sp. 02P26C-1]|uniref:hypothetical protein n=1 Tax=Bordetella sp. 02P26C-1 TaxID=2683195 RepID=UPI001352C769|nr:hypothetical protein [Bordetella sp. 02P26C-1]MVW79108.1 hypothetical protein [Bordetella sp. 02P26C-1]